MRVNLLRLTTLPTVAAIVLTGFVLTSPGASADPEPDPVTTGAVTLDLSLDALTPYAKGRIVVVPTKPAAASFDEATRSIEYTLPVTGGDASTNTLYGDLKLGGSLIFIDFRHHKQVKLTNIKFTIQDDTISATPAGKTTPVVLFDAFGDHEYTTTTPETFSASDVQIDPAGAKYLNQALHTDIFHGGASIGTFASSFTNTVDAG